MKKLVRRIVAVLVIVGITIFAVRAFESQRGPSLELWHTFVPHDMKAGDIAKADWGKYLAAEDALFTEVRTHVTDKLEGDARNPANRYFDGSPIYPGHFKQDWNRSYTLEPVGPPIGAVVLLHGLTDSPYSLRHIARRYRDLGFVAVAIRLPGHGTVPAGLSVVQWEAWAEATRLAVREARRMAPTGPLHLIGFSNGGALAMKYALDGIENKSLPRPDRIVLLSPMIGITSLARFAGIFGWPAVFPPFAKAAWLGIVPEFNPFKYNSFPVNGARQSSLVSRTLQRQIADYAKDGRLGELPPILTFQSVVDFTVSARAIVTSLYDNLPKNGSELVLFDVNRSARFGPLLRVRADTALTRLLPEPPRNFATAVVTNISPMAGAVRVRTVAAGSTTEQVHELGLAYPDDVFSLSHVAVPFPVSDPLYGIKPENDENFGVNLGAMATRGEIGTLIVTLDSLVRMASNPFYPYMLERIEEGIVGRPATKSAEAGTVVPVQLSTAAVKAAGAATLK